MSYILLALFPLITLILFGYLFKKYHVFADGFWVGTEKLNYYLLFPALLFHTLATAKIDFQMLKGVMLAMWMVFAIATSALYGLRRMVDIHPARFGVHVQGVLRFNTYIGLALVAALYPKSGLAILVVLLAVSIPVVNVISVLSLTPSEEMAFQPVLRMLCKNPLILSCLAGALVNALHMPIWDGILNLCKLFSASSLPLGLLCVGAALQFMQMKHDFLVLMADSFARLLIMPVLAYTVCVFLNLSPLETQILVLFFALPTASASYILTKVLKGDSQLMAAVISVQTLCAALSLPILIWWVG